MRADMYKVIVERPRLIHGNWLRGGREVGFRQFLASEDRPHKIGMRAGHTRRKWPNENLAPPRRFLVSNAGRPWDKVRSELLNGIDQRNTVQQHILTHVDDYVEREIRLVPRENGKGQRIEFRPRWKREWTPIEESFAPLFVDPRTGILRLTRSAEKRAQRKREEAKRMAVDRGKDVRPLGSGLELQRFDDVWYEVEYEKIPGEQISRWQRRFAKDEEKNKWPRVYDVLEKKWVSLWDTTHYVTKKRQLNSKEIAKRALRK
jgi:hypothetical protein